MNRILALLLPLLPIVFWQKLAPHLLSPTSDPARGGSPNARTLIIGALAEKAGARDLDQTSLTLIGFGAMLYSVAFGFLTHVLLGDKGLGVRVNGFLGFVGAGAAVAAWFALSARQGAFNPTAACFAAVLGSTLLLVGVCLLKAAVFVALDDYLSGAARVHGGGSRASSRVDAVVRRR